MKLTRANVPLSTSKLQFHLPEIRLFTLKNGLNVFFIEKNTLPIIQMTLLVNAGSRFDPTKQHGLSYLTSLLLDEGAGEYSALELDNEIESLGSIFGISTDSDLTYLNMMTMNDKFQRSLELFSTIFYSPLFTDDDFEREKKKLLTNIVRKYDDPSFIASVNFKKQLFNDSTYAHSVLGNLKSVESISNSDVKQFYNDNFSPSNTHLVVVGNISQARLEENLNSYFSKSFLKPTMDNVISNPHPSNNRVFFIHKDSAAQSEIRVGHLTNKRTDPDYFSKIIMNSILGGQFSSRLNLNLREDKGFTYGVSSGFYYNREFGHFQISTSVQNENTGKAIEEINKEIYGIKESISDEEINFAKSYLIKRFPAMFETYSQIANNLSSLFHYSLDLEYFNNYISNINNCSKDDINNAAQNRIINDELKYVIVGDRKVVLPQLKSALNMDIVELDKFGIPIS